ncbi:MAG: pseudaminic acid synthase, partial [Ferrovibrionaceae bacterium]
IDHDGPGFVIESGPWAGRRLHDLYAEAHTPWSWHEPLFAKAKMLGLGVFASVFDETSIDFLEDLGCPAYKIASFEIVDLPLIARAAATGKPLIISTGMAGLGDIEAAVSAARAAGARDLILLHCVSGYPTPAAEANLATIGHLGRAFDTIVGLSDHTLGVAVSVAAVALGAAVIEKHVTLRRADGGPDAGFSLEPEELALLCAATADAWAARGTVMYGNKPSEAASRQFRRSLYAVRDIKAGEALTADNVRSIRPGFGLAPKYLPRVLGSRALQDIAKGTPLGWKMIAEAGPNG